jgi:hypothetical protein
MMALPTQATRVLVARVEAEDELNSADDPEERHFRPGFLTQLMSQTHRGEPRQVKPLSTTVSALGSRLTSRLHRYASGPVAVVVESRHEVLPIDSHYDDLLIEVARAQLKRVRDEEGVHVCCVTFVVARPDVMVQRSTSLDYIGERLRASDTAVFVLCEDEHEVAGERARRLNLQMPSHQHSAGSRSAVFEHTTTSNEVGDAWDASELVTQTLGLLDFEFDHFVIAPSERERPLHVPCLLSCEALAQSTEAVASVQTALAVFAGGERWTAHPLEFDGAGIAEPLLPQILGGDASRLDDGKRSLEGERVIILTDIAYLPARLAHAVNAAKDRGAEWAGVFAMVATSEPLPPGLEFRSILELPITSALEENECEMCRLGVEPITGNGIRDVRRSLTQYQPVVFWRLMALMQSFTRVGHWASPRTPNHFWLRVLMGNVLQSFGSSMAARIVRILEREAGVMMSWVDAIIVAEDPESVALAEAIQRTVRQRSLEIISVERSILREVSPHELSDPANDWVATASERVGPRANVLIVDQAAHHLRTYTALKTLCDTAGWHTLAFCVVLDRTGIDSDAREQLHDSHYVALYSWPFPPRIASACTCSHGGGV